MYYNMNKKLIRLTENNLHRIVKESVNRVINEINLGNGSIDFDDWHITSLKSNEDGYYEFEARCDNDWYTLRGSYYGNGEIELDFLLSGHSGYGRQIPINKKLQSGYERNIVKNKYRGCAYLNMHTPLWNGQMSMISTPLS